MPSASIIRRLHHVVAAMAACAAIVCARGPKEACAGTMYVTYYNTGKVATWDTNGTLIGDFATTNLSNSVGIVLDSAGNAWVSNATGGTYAQTVSRFNASGIYQGNITANLNDPAGLARDSAGNLYVANYLGDKVTKYDSTGAFLTQFGNATNVDGPQGIAIDASGNVFTANNIPNTISKFDSSGTFVGTFASVTKPAGMAFDSTGNLYVASYTGNQILKYDPAGSLLQTITDASLNQPYGFAIDPDGNLYAANAGGNSITAFDSAGVFLRTWSLGDGAANRPAFIAFQPVPEPTRLAIVSLGAGLGLAATIRRWGRRR